MKELNVAEIESVSGGYWHRLAFGVVSFVAGLDYSGASHNSSNMSAATNRL